MQRPFSKRLRCTQGGACRLKLTLEIKDLADDIVPAPKPLLSGNYKINANKVKCHFRSIEVQEFRDAYRKTSIKPPPLIIRPSFQAQIANNPPSLLGPFLSWK